MSCVEGLALGQSTPPLFLHELSGNERVGRNSIGYPTVTPRELRDSVYQYLSGTNVLKSKFLATEKTSSSPLLHPHTCLAILHLSNSIHEEAKIVFYRYVLFSFQGYVGRSPSCMTRQEVFQLLECCKTSHSIWSAPKRSCQTRTHRTRDATAQLLRKGLQYPRQTLCGRNHFPIRFGLRCGVYRCKNGFPRCVGSLDRIQNCGVEDEACGE